MMKVCRQEIAKTEKDENKRQRTRNGKMPKNFVHLFEK